jgi:hypothetical protein
MYETLSNLLTRYGMEGILWNLIKILDSYEEDYIKQLKNELNDVLLRYQARNKDV